MGRLTLLVTSPRLPAGLLTGAAWRVLDSAGLVAVRDASTPVARALAAAEIEVMELHSAWSDDLLELAADRWVVWLAAEDGDEPLARALAEAVVLRAAEGRPGPDVELLVGSFDPPGARLLDAVAVMDALRERCPWDREQTHASLVRYLVEEAYELVEAIETGDRSDLLCEELGDLLFQVLFHAKVASENAEEPFTIDDVAGGLVDKLVRRHPHVFGDTEVSGAAEVEANWDAIKRAEKGRRSSMDGIPLGLPALSLADTVIDRALRARSSLSVPLPTGETAYTEDTLGDVLFALVAAAHAGGLDPERALRARVRGEVDALRAAEQRAVPAEGEQPG